MLASVSRTTRRRCILGWDQPAPTPPPPPIATFSVNAGGASYEPDADAWPNFVFYEELRPFVEEYYAWLGAQLANVTAAGLVSGLRLGGGHYGELSYPRGGPPGGVFWAFDPRAAAKNPVPWWRPGSLSPNGEALTFLTWYLGSMADYQDWQVVVAGAAFPGVPLAVLYPGAEVRRPHSPRPASPVTVVPPGCRRVYRT